MGETIKERKKLFILVPLMAPCSLLFEHEAPQFIPRPGNYGVGPTHWSVVPDELGLTEEGAKIRCSPDSL